MSTTETTSPEPSDDDRVDVANRTHTARTFDVGFTVEVDRFETTVYLGGNFVFCDEGNPDTFDTTIGEMRYLTYAERRDRALEKVGNGLYHLMRMPAVVEANSLV